MNKLPSESLTPEPTQPTAEDSTNELIKLEEQIENMGLEGMEELYGTLQQQPDETLMALLSKRLHQRSAAVSENHPLSENQLLSELLTKRILHQRFTDSLVEDAKDLTTEGLEEELRKIMEKPTTVIEEAMKTKEPEEFKEFADLIRDMATEPNVAYIDLFTVKELALRRILDQRRAAEKSEGS